MQMFSPIRKGMSHTILPLTQELFDLGYNGGVTEGGPPKFESPEGTAMLARCKEAFYHVACGLKHTGRRVLVPAYTCNTVFLPFNQEGWTHDFYKIDRHMRIDGEDFLRQLKAFRPDVVVVHPYYGQDLNEQEQALMKAAKAQGCFILEDLTQAMDSKRRYDFVDAYCGSMRKWLSIPDGGFYHSKALPLDDSALPEFEEFVVGMRDAMYISNLFKETGTHRLYVIANHINKLGGEGMCRTVPTELHRMSDFSRRILHGFDFDAYAARRLENARYLWENLKDSTECDMVYKDVSDITSGPLFFPFYPKMDVLEFNKTRLHPHSIKGVTMWRNQVEENCQTLTGDKTEVEGLYNDMLLVPIGLDFGKEEMDRIIKAINTRPE